MRKSKLNCSGEIIGYDCKHKKKKKEKRKKTEKEVSTETSVVLENEVTIIDTETLTKWCRIN